MALKTCRVTIKDIEGIDHTADVTAETLYEAVARGIVALKANSWTAELCTGRAQVTVHDTPVEHSVLLREFHSWVSRINTIPKEMTHRKKIREILEKK